MSIGMDNIAGLSTSLRTIEAMARGISVVIFKAESLPGVLADAGLMYPDDYRGLAEAKYALLTHKRFRRSLMKRD
jgi:glycosyltransferase involved in cell wall biosynthesis